MSFPFYGILRPEDTQDSELDALQTDVMRFLAIIAFCLLVIFIPLLKTIPVSPKTELPQVQKEDVLDECENLESTIHQLETRINALKEEVEREQSRRISEEKELEQEWQRLARVRTEVDTLRQKYLEEEITRKSLEKKLAEEKEKTTRIGEAIEELELRFMKTTPLSTPQKKTVQIVRFQSPSVLLDLIRKNKVEFYVYFSGHYFRLHITSLNDLLFHQTDVTDPWKRLYKLATSTVPPQIRRAFREKFLSYPRAEQDCIYIVHWSKKIEKELNSSRKSGKSGEFVITEDEGVVLVPRKDAG